MSGLRQLKVTFDSFDDLVEGIGPGLSRTHLFARTQEVIADGTRIRLAIGTVGKGALIRGVAKVAGVAAPDSEAGLNLHIIHLDPSSTRIVDSIVRGEVAVVGAREASGPSPFDISPALEDEEARPEDPSSRSEPAPMAPAMEESVADAPAVEMPDLEESPAAAPVLGSSADAPDLASSADAPEVVTRASRPVWRFAWPLALAGVVLLLFKLGTGREVDDPLLTGRDRQTEATVPVEFSAAGAPAEETAAKETAAKETAAKETAAKETAAKETAAEETAAKETAAGPLAPNGQPAGSDPIGPGVAAAKPEAATPVGREPEAAAGQAEAAVRAWAAAWSRQDPAAYLELYAANYSPPGLDREAWKRQRRARITAPAQLEIRVHELQIEIAAPDRASAHFQQLYLADDKALSAYKVLELERFETGWKIVAERVEK